MAEQPDRYRFETLGDPLQTKPVAMDVVTRGANERFIAWGVVEAPGRYGVLGVYTDNGQTVWLETTGYGQSHIRLHAAPNGALYLYAGVPGRFLKYDPRQGKLTDLGVPAQNASYWLGQAIGPDGTFYVGTYPEARLVAVDPRTDQVTDLGRLPEDARQKYLTHPAVADDGVLYLPVGLHHAELWSLDRRTGRKRQILPEALSAHQGAVDVWTGTDGRVYGKGQGREFLCGPDGITFQPTGPRRRDADATRAGEEHAIELTATGELRLRSAATGAMRSVATEARGAGVRLFSVGCEHGGQIYGGGFQPANLFSCDPATGALRDLGHVTGGNIQIYDVFSHPRGLFLSSYMGANLDFFDPARPVKPGENPRPIATLSSEYQQERAPQLALGPDGMLYTGTVPVKGHLGGALVRIDPNDFRVKVWRNLVPEQSLLAVVPVPETGEIFCTATIAGGSSAIPTAKAAHVLLWDVKKEQITWQGEPIPGATAYERAVRAKNGLIYGLAGNQYYAFDAVHRKVVHTGRLPVTQLHWPSLADTPAGPDGLLVGLGEDALFAIDPADHSARILARHPSIRDAHGMLATEVGMLYYGSGATLMRVNLADGKR